MGSLNNLLISPQRW